MIRARPLFALVLAAAAGALAASSAPARAEDAPVEVSSCVIQGKTTPPANLEIFAQPAGGKPIARFSGAQSFAALSEMSARLLDRRARVKTSNGAGGFRIDGYVDATQLGAFTKSLVPSIPGHVWIGQGREVRLVGADAGGVKIEKKLTTPMGQTFSGRATCEGLTLDPQIPPGAEVPGNARGYVAKESFDLFPEPSKDATAVLTLYPSTDAGILFWSERRQGNWVHLHYSGEVTIEGWARAKDLKPLPRGETMDYAVGGIRKRDGARLALAEEPRVVTAPKDVPIRGQSSETAPVLGVIESGTETYVTQVVAGWASVLPKSLHVVPPADQHFWVSAKDLGL
ncbi:MAG: hypothetical protein IT376_16150 [Polyangiaceae bacterium]|nr:hypothetical protein [Polyangiaceae bacterium]